MILKKLVFAGIAGAILSSCTVAATHTATGNPVGTKVGVAKSKIFGDSDHSIQAAAKNGGITKIGSVDIVTKVFIFPITKTVVTGE